MFLSLLIMFYFLISFFFFVPQFRFFTQFFPPVPFSSLLFFSQTFCFANESFWTYFQGVVFKLEIKNLAMSDSKGHDLEKEIVVRVMNVPSKQVSNVHVVGVRG